jgi:uncharacterized protein with HEPN domain
MTDEVRKYLFDALEASKYAKEFTKDKSFEEYAEDELLKSAVERKLEIVGESLNRIKKKDLKSLDKIREWRDIVAFRNNLAHSYDHINHTLVWSILHDDIDNLVSDLSKALNES